MKARPFPRIRTRLVGAFQNSFRANESERETFRDWASVQGLGLRSRKRKGGKRMAYCGT